MSHNSLSMFLNLGDGARPKLVRNSLKEQTIDRLRDDIVRARIPPGTALVEREVAEELAISRAPVRDALMELEREGLVESRGNRRYVIQLCEEDVRELYQVRRALETLAVRLATRNTCPENCAALLAGVRVMREAVANRDIADHVGADMQMHRLIWEQAENRHLFRMLTSMFGPILMFVSNNAEAYDWGETLTLHEDLVACVNSGDEEAAVESIERHIDEASERSLGLFPTPQAPADAGDAHD
jgi:DNA-binding GntR family transcriptional regulator